MKITIRLLKPTLLMIVLMVAAIGAQTATRTGNTIADDVISVKQDSNTPAAAAVIRLVSVSGTQNSNVVVEVEMEAQGNEVNTAYSLHFDPGVLSIRPNTNGTLGNPDVTAGAGAPAGTTVGVNANGIATGDIGVFENFNAAGLIPPAVITAGTRRITRFTFHILGTAPLGSVSPVMFTDSPVAKFTANSDNLASSFAYQNGTVTVTSAIAANVSISGRVMTPSGSGLRNATVVLTDSSGNRRTATTSSFGFYQFDDVAPGGTVVIGVISRSYRFSTRTVFVTDNLVNQDFTGLE